MVGIVRFEKLFKEPTVRIRGCYTISRPRIFIARVMPFNKTCLEPSGDLGQIESMDVLYLDSTCLIVWIKGVGVY